MEGDPMERELPAMAMDEWLRRLADAAGPTPEPLTISVVEQRLLLDIARVAAHTSERVAAPISTYLVGLMMATVSPELRGQELDRIRRAIDVSED
jgi:hypothetical protein